MDLTRGCFIKDKRNKTWIIIVPSAEGYLVTDPLLKNAPAYLHRRHIKTVLKYRAKIQLYRSCRNFYEMHISPIEPMPKKYKASKRCPGYIYCYNIEHDKDYSSSNWSPINTKPIKGGAITRRKAKP